MPRKRKLTSSSQTTPEPPQKQQQTEQPQQTEPEEEYEEVEEEYEVEEEVDDDDDEDDDQDDEDEEPISNLLEPFTKDQLIRLVSEAAESNPDVLDRVRKLADEDPVHRKIFVHGLRWDTTNDTLFDEFKQYGDIEECKAVVDKVSGKSKGYGFILFRSRKGARNALKEPQKLINSRMTSCQLAAVGPVVGKDKGVGVEGWSGGGAGGAGAGAGESDYTRKKIYVSNVGAELDPGKLYEFFAKFGEIEEGPLGLDKATGKPKGFCLFVYKTAESVKKALEVPHKNFEGHVLHCQRAVDGPKYAKGKNQQQQQNPQSGYFQRNENPGFVGGTAVGAGHLMAPSGPAIGFNQGASVNPALGQALTALLSNPAAGLGLTNLLGFGSAGGANPGVPGVGPGIPGGYGQANISQGMMGGYGNQGMQGGYGNQPMGPGGAGRGQHGQYGGASHKMGR